MRDMQINKNESIAVRQSFNKKEYWLDNLSGEWQRSSFPYDYRRKTLNKRHIQVMEFKLAGEVCALLMKLSNKSDSRLHMILVAAVTFLVNQYTGSRDIIIGTTIDRQDFEADFINTILPLRNKIEEGMTFKELLLQVRETILHGVRNQNFPIESLLNQLDLMNSGDGFPLFDIAVLLENIHDKGYLGDIPISQIFYFKRTHQYIKGCLEYDTALYDQTTIKEIVTYFRRLLQETLLNINVELSQLEILTEEEKKQILFAINDNASEYPRDKTLQQLFEEQVVKTPQHTALIQMDDGRRVTYMELNDKANQLALLLAARGIKADTIVGLLVDRSIEMMVGILGILKAGGAYLAMDPASPAQRIQFMLKDSETKVLVTRRKIAESADDPYTDHVVCLDDIRIYREDSGNLRHTSSMHNLAYIIYTSGTTGNPKGVLMEHRGVVNYLSWAVQNYVKGETIHFPLYTSISFDLTVTSTFSPLITGNTIFIYGEAVDEFLIERIVRENKVGVIKLTPSHLKLIRNIDRSNDTTGIKRLIVGGEKFDTQLAWSINHMFNGNIEIYNEYGPTEAAVGCMIYQYTPAVDKRPSVPLGIPADNVQIYLLDARLKPVPKGALGEIYISGRGVARGYLNNPQLTAEKFIPNPFSMAHNPMMYRTGDLARRLSNGNLEFWGRTDEQVNIRGFRVELGEIEAHLLKQGQIKDALVIARKDSSGNQYICAYLVAAGINADMNPKPGKAQSSIHPQISVEDIKAYLSKKLPNYMLPSYFVFLDEIPLTTNGKLNKKALPQPYENMETGTLYVSPRNEVETKLAKIWEKELELEKIGINDNFFNIGGDSIKSIGLISSINSAFGQTLKLRDLYKNETIEKLAVLIEKGEVHHSLEKYKAVSDEMDAIKDEFLAAI
ncbi:MAG: non-ribosomal peptide synthetase [Candidatus Aminicenantes bacterium]